MDQWAYCDVKEIFVGSVVHKICLIQYLQRHLWVFALTIKSGSTIYEMSDYKKLHSQNPRLNFVLFWIIKWYIFIVIFFYILGKQNERRLKERSYMQMR